MITWLTVTAFSNGNRLQVQPKLVMSNKHRLMAIALKLLLLVPPPTWRSTHARFRFASVHAGLSRLK
ncbi:hypothetical protein RSAG8_01382, partial [Rhizoctonia solani AG-8 WAC10335]